MKIELAPTDSVDHLAPQIHQILRAMAEVCDEPGFASALVTDESYFSDFGLDAEDYARLSQKLGIAIDPQCKDDWSLCAVAAKLARLAKA